MTTVLDAPNAEAFGDAETEYRNALARDREHEWSDRDVGTGWVIPGGSQYDEERFSFEQLEERYAECPDLRSGAIDWQRSQFVEAAPYKIKGRRGRMRASTLRYRQVDSVEELKRLQEGAGFTTKMEEWNWSPDPFAYGYQQSVPGAGPSVLGEYLPIWPGPVTRQLYWQDYFAMSAKAFEAYNHDPISWRCVHMKQEFALGKGVLAQVTYSSGSQAGKHHDKADDVWKEFWDRNNMDVKMDMLARDISVMGEQFLRYFVNTRSKLVTVRSLDPASIYDLITDPEDHETVFAYHQQFQTPYQLYPPTDSTPPTGDQSPFGPTQTGAATRFIIRQILPQEVDHYKLNAGAYERRGRSDLFPALGWIRRLRDYLTSKVIRADMMSRICWDLEVAGNVSAIQNLQSQLFPAGAAPQPGTVFGHNSATKLNALVPQGSDAGVRFDPVLDALVTMVACSIGLPKDWLGFGMQTTRASALVATEPAARSLEELQGTVEMILHDMFDRVMAAAKITDAEVEFTFPSIATEDRSTKLKDLAFCESMNWFAKPTSAAMAGKEMGVTGYDFDEEQGLIADQWDNAAETEDDPTKPQLLGPDGNPISSQKPQKPKQGDGTIRRPMLNGQYRQTPALDPTRSVQGQEDEAPGLLVPFSGPTPPPGGDGGGGAPPGAAKPPAAAQGPGQPGTTPNAPGRGGTPQGENPNSAAGAKNIKQDMNAGGGVGRVTETFTADEVIDMFARMRMAERRRSPDDPEFQRLAQGYREQAAASMAQLVRDAVGSGAASEVG